MANTWLTTSFRHRFILLAKSLQTLGFTMKILARYLIWEVFRAGWIVLALLLGLFLFFDLIYELSELGQGSYHVGKLFIHVLLLLPGHSYELLPIAVLIGGILALSLLCRHSEYTVMRISGLSIGSIIRYLLLTGSLFALITLLLGEYIAPLSERIARQFRLAATGKMVAQEFRSGLWAKDTNSFINVREILPDNSLRNINIYQFDSSRQLLSITHAQTAHWQQAKQWKLSQVSVLTFHADHTSLSHWPEKSWDTIFSPNMFAILLVVPEQMSVQSLFRYIQHLRNNQQKTDRYEIALWSKLFYPLACLSMLVIALPFAQTSQRNTNIGVKIFVGIMLGLGFHFINKLSGHLGLLYAWPPWLATTAPSLLFLSAALTLLYWQERR